MKLSKEQKMELHRLIVSAFSVEQLRILFAYSPGLGGQLEEFVDTKQGLDGLVFDLIEDIERRGLEASLISAVLKARPDRDDIQLTLKPMLIALGGAPAEIKQQVENVTIGLGEVDSGLPNEAVRHLVEDLKSVLSKLAEDIALLRTYKSLHDVLHTFQKSLRSLALMVREIQVNPNNLDLLQLIADFDEQIATATTALLELPSDPPVVQVVEKNWINRIEDAINILNEAVRASDAALGRQGVKKIKDVVQVQPARVNGNLSVTAGALNLIDLKTLFSKARNLPHVAESISSNLSRGEDATEQISRNVRALVNQHTEWQEIDIDLKSAGPSIPKSEIDDPSDFDASWKGVKQRLEKLVGIEPNSVWAIELISAANEVDSSRGAEDLALNIEKLRGDFDRFLIQATTKFFKLDKDLLKLTNAIAPVGDALLDLLKKI